MEYVLTRKLLETIIGRTDLSPKQQRHRAQQYANLLMALAEQQVELNSSRKTIQQNIVTLITPSKKTETALKLTENGFLVTTYHGIHAVEEIWTQKTQHDITLASAGEFLNQAAGYCIIDANRKIYSLDTSFYLADPAHDLVLLKAVMPGRMKPLPYNISNRRIEQDEQLTLLTMNGAFKKTNAYVSTANPEFTAPNHHTDSQQHLFWAHSDAAIQPGWSGGAIIDQAGSLHGIIKGEFTTTSTPCIVGIPSIYLTYLLGKASLYFEQKTKRTLACHRHPTL